MNTPNIALYGNKETGKSTYSKWMKAEYGHQIFSYAAGVRELTAQIINEMAEAPVPWKETYKYIFLDKDRYTLYKSTTFQYYNYEFVDGMRAIMKGAGNGARDSIGENVWVDALDNKLRKAGMNSPGGGCYVIDDCRYPNEANSQQDRWEAIVIYLERPGSDIDHPSEQCEQYVKEGLVDPEYTLPYVRGADGMEATKTRIREIIEEHAD